MRWIHIIAGLIALFAGAFAIYAPKGSKLHRRSGVVFALAMFTLTTSAVIMAGFLRPNQINAMAGTLTFYLVSTGWLAIRRTVTQARVLLIGFMLAALAGGLYAFSLGFQALASVKGNLGGIPAPPLFMFGVIGLAGALLDARLLWVGHIEGAQRILRHLWRMAFAMWIATASFFLGQPQIFPEPIRKSGLLVIPVLIVALFGIYWVARVTWMRRRAMKDILGRRASPTAGKFVQQAAVSITPS